MFYVLNISYSFPEKALMQISASFPHGMDANARLSNLCRPTFIAGRKQTL